MSEPDITNDLLYRSACRMKRFIELEANEELIRAEVRIAEEYARLKYEDPEVYQRECREKATSRAVIHS